MQDFLHAVSVLEMVYRCCFSVFRASQTHPISSGGLGRTTSRAMHCRRQLKDYNIVGPSTHSIVLLLGVSGQSWALYWVHKKTTTSEFPWVSRWKENVQALMIRGSRNDRGDVDLVDVDVQERKDWNCAPTAGDRDLTRQHETRANREHQ